MTEREKKDLGLWHDANFDAELLEARRRADSFRPSISVTVGWRRPLGGGAQKERHDIRRVFLWYG